MTTTTLGDSGLVELLDRLIDTGVVASGDLLLGLADIDLIRVDLKLALGSVDTLSRDPVEPRPSEYVAPSPTELAVSLPADRSELGVGALLVTVIEIVHGLLERQAIHRMEHGTLTDDQVERLGHALQALDIRTRQLIELFRTDPTPELLVAIAGAAH